MINSRDIKELNPKVARLCEAFVAACLVQGIEVKIISTYRDGDYQNSLYAQGRTLPGKKVTNAKSGQSWHNFRCAFDFCPSVNGKLQWNDIATFKRCGEIAESVGLEWAGRWKSFQEMAHCQFTGGLTLADLRSGKKI